MMYCTYIVKRTQIYLEPEQSRALARRANVRGVTSSHLIREAITAYLADPTDDAGELAAQRSALLGSAGTIPDLPPGIEAVERLRDGDQARDQELEARWRST